MPSSPKRLVVTPASGAEPELTPREPAREASSADMNSAPAHNRVSTQLPSCAGELAVPPEAARIAVPASEYERQMMRCQSLELLRAVFRDLAHDLNNALAPLLMGCSVLRQTATDATAAGLPAIMEAAAQRGAALVSHIMTLSSAATGPRGLLDPAPLARRVLQAMEASSRQQTRFQFAIPATLWPVAAEPLLLEQLLLAACLRARHVVRKGGSLTVSAANADAESPPLAGPRRGEPGAFVRFRFSLRPLAQQTAQSALAVAAAGRPANPNGGANSSWHDGLEVMARELGGTVKTSPASPGETHLDLLLPATPTPLSGKVAVPGNL
jgi:signal transduction histidine kinase